MDSRCREVSENIGFEYCILVISYSGEMVRSAGFWVGLVGLISFQKIYGLYGLKHHRVEISGDVTDAGRTDEQTNDK